MVFLFKKTPNVAGVGLYGNLALKYQLYILRNKYQKIIFKKIVKSRLFRAESRTRFQVRQSIVHATFLKFLYPVTAGRMRHEAVRTFYQQ